MKQSSLLVVTFLAVVSGTTALGDDTVTGVVFWDRNANGTKDWCEPGLPGVCVSNGKEVVKTGWCGTYELPAYDDMVVFVVKPSGWMTPVNEHNIPLFSYVHKPAGSPPEIQKYRGLAPTGPLPESVDFPLYKGHDSKRFQALITGDTQVYNDREINYLRDSLVKEAQGTDALFCISMGDNLGDDLSLFPRYLEVMGSMGIPVYYVPGNHDLDFDAPSDQDSFDTHKSYIGATYYSFNYGKVHFVVLDSVEYPAEGGGYNGVISPVQMEWLANDLAYVPESYLIVLNMHIPIVSDVDRMSTTHQVDNREELYALLEGRKVVSLGGHTHTISHFQPGDELEGWGQPTPIAQIIVGAACGSWWSGDLDDAGMPLSYMRCGAPRGHMMFEFNGKDYKDNYKAHGKPADKQMSLSLLTPDFDGWLTSLYDVVDPNTGGITDPTVIHGLDDRNRIPVADLGASLLVANVWNGSMHASVTCQFDCGPKVDAQWNMDSIDPFALPLQLYVLRGVPGFRLWDKEYSGAQYGPGYPVVLDGWLWTTGGKSTHLWTCPLPTDLVPGVHKVTVRTTDVYGQQYEETKVFEVVE